MRQTIKEILDTFTTVETLNETYMDEFNQTKTDDCNYNSLGLLNHINVNLHESVGVTIDYEYMRSVEALVNVINKADTNVMSLLWQAKITTNNALTNPMISRYTILPNKQVLSANAFIRSNQSITKYAWILFKSIEDYAFFCDQRPEIFYNYNEGAEESVALQLIPFSNEYMIDIGKSEIDQVHIHEFLNEQNIMKIIVKHLNQYYEDWGFNDCWENNNKQMKGFYTCP